LRRGNVGENETRNSHVCIGKDTGDVTLVINVISLMRKQVYVHFSLIMADVDMGMVASINTFVKIPENWMKYEILEVN
jgi:hypothetical protein